MSYDDVLPKPWGSKFEDEKFTDLETFLIDCKLDDIADNHEGYTTQVEAHATGETIEAKFIVYKRVKKNIEKQFEYLLDRNDLTWILLAERFLG